MMQEEKISNSAHGVRTYQKTPDSTKINFSIAPDVGTMSRSFACKIGATLHPIYESVGGVVDAQVL